MQKVLRIACIGWGLCLLMSIGVMFWTRRETASSNYWLAYVSETQIGETHLYLSLPDGGSRRRLLSNLGMVHRMSFSPDNQELVFDADLLASFPSSDPSSGATLYPQIYAGSIQSQLYLLSVADGNLTRLTQGFIQAYAPAWSPNGEWIAFLGYEGYQFDNSTPNFYPGIGAVYDAYQVYLMRPDGSEMRTLGETHEYGRVFWSPDSRWLSYVSVATGDSEIYKVAVETGQRQRLTFMPSFELSPAWSPDGEWIVFLSDQDNMQGIYNLFIMQANGLNMRRLSFSNQFEGAPIWSPDGEWIAFVRQEYLGVHHIYRIRPDGSDLQRLSPLDGSSSWAPTWSKAVELAWQGILPMGIGIVAILGGLSGGLLERLVRK